MTEQKPFDLTKVISGGRVVIPLPLRKLLGINEGDYLAVYLEGNKITYEPVTIQSKSKSS